MSTLSYIDSMWIDILAWSIIHSLWQGMLIGGVVWLVTSLLGARTARFRHNLHLTGLVSFFMLHLATVVILYGKMSGTGSSAIDPALSSISGWVDSGVIIAVKDSSIWDRTFGVVAEHTGLIFFIWLSGMLFFSMKMIWQVSASYWIRNAGIELCPPGWMTSWHKIMQNYKVGNQVNFRLSSIVESPVVTGFLKPVILFPVAAVNHLTIDQVEAILHHELSHLARKDQWWNLFISFMETCYYYHPMVWFMTGQVRRERENSVDDRVLAMGVNPLKYAESLMVLQDIKRHHRQLALGAVGHKGELLQRIKRILGQPQKTNTMKQKLSSIMVIGLLMIAWGISSGFSDKAVEDHVISNEVEVLTDTIPPSLNGKVTVVDKNGDKTQMQVRNGKVVEARKNGKAIPESEFQKLEKAIEIQAPPIVPGHMISPPSPGIPAPEMLLLDDLTGDRQIEVIVEKMGEEEVIVIENGKEHRIKVMPEGKMRFFHEKDMKLKHPHNRQFMPKHDMRFMPGKEFRIMKLEKDGGQGFQIIVDSIEWHGDVEAPEVFEIPMPDLEMMELNLEGMTEEEMMRVKAEMKKAKEELKGLRFEIIKQYEDAKDEHRRMEVKIQKEVEDGMNKMILKAPNMKYNKLDKGLFLHRPGPGSPLERALLQDGYIENVQDYSFKMNESRIKVDGKRITGEEYERYKRIYEKQTGKSLPDEFNISIKKDQ